MRNLGLVRKLGCGLTLRDSDQDPCFCVGEQSTLTAVDQTSNCLHHFKTEGGHRQGDIIGDNDNVSLDGVHQIQHVATMGYFFVCKKSGEFYQIFDSSGGLEVNCTELFKSSEGIETFCVSSDCRRVVILTRKSSVLVLSLPDLQCLVVHQLVAEGEQVDNNCSIAWRHDSRYFVINVPKPSSNSRELRVYDEEGALYSTSQLDEFRNENGALAWQPSGGLIACVASSPHGKCVLFSELNGLKRSELRLEGKEDEEEVVGISWNLNSDILALRYSSKVELWTRSNYVWMLKKTLKCEDKFSFCEWDTELPYRLHTLTKKEYFTYDLSFKFTTGYSVAGSGLVVSWNGKHIYATLTSRNSAPPPYGFLQAEVESNIVEVIVSSFGDDFLCVTERELILFRLDELTLIPYSKLTFPSDFSAVQIESWSWPHISILYYISDGILNAFDLDFDLFPTNEQQKTLTRSRTIQLETQKERLTRLFPLPHTSKEILVETEQNNFYRLCLSTNANFKELSCKSVFSTLGSLKFDDNCILYFLHDQLTRKLMMHCSTNENSELISLSSDCISFTTFQGNLLLTTSSGSLEILDRSFIEHLLENPNKPQSLFKEVRFVRKVEKGSVIVSCCINSMLEPSLILEILPRGNFETICPRPLLVSTIRSILNNNADQQNNTCYEKIMTALRRHRLDYKVLIDEMRKVEPKQSLSQSLAALVEQVKDSHALVLLVTDLDSDYSDCIQIIKQLLEKSQLENNNRQPNVEEAYLASLAKLGLLEEALVCPLILGESKEQRNLVTHRVKFLSYYCDNPELLFDTSLGTYDLSLASLVADCLGKDPKEYIPMLEELNQLSELKRKFKIDDKLRRYSKASSALILDHSSQTHEIIKYIERHRLFTDSIICIEQTLESISSDEDQRMGNLLTEIRTSYGNYLEEHNKLKEAIIQYRYGAQYDKAINCAIKCGEWELALDVFYNTQKYPESESELQPLCNKILVELEEKKNFAGAARLCEIYLKDFSRAVDYWTQDHKWITARTLSRLTPSPQKCIQELILPKLLDTAAERTEQLTSLMEEVNNCFSRWRTVKALKALKELEGGGGDELDNFSDADSISSASSYSSKSGSVSSGKTFRSGKNKRKMERKLYSMKEGSTHEDLGITAHLWGLGEKMERELKGDTTELVRGLWEFGQESKAVELGTLFDLTLATMGRSIQEIWVTGPLTDELLEMRFRVPPPGWSTSWDKLCLHEPSSKATKK